MNKILITDKRAYVTMRWTYPLFFLFWGVGAVAFFVITIGEAFQGVVRWQVILLFVPFLYMFFFSLNIYLRARVMEVDDEGLHTAKEFIPWERIIRATYWRIGSSVLVMRYREDTRSRYVMTLAPPSEEIILNPITHRWEQRIAGTLFRKENVLRVMVRAYSSDPGKAAL